MAAETLRFRIGGMDCAACATKIETAVSRLPGVTEASVSLGAATMRVAPANIDRGAIERQVTALGYTIAPANGAAAPSAAGGHDHDHGDAHGAPIDGPWWRTRKAILTGLCAAALVVAWLIGMAWPQTGHWAFLAAMLVGLLPVAQRAFVAARAGTPFSIETLMTIAAVGAVVIGATEEAATVVLLFLVGELLEGIAAARARRSIGDLAKLVPRTALVVEADATREAPADALAPGMLIRVRPGERIAADGVVVAGRSAVDEAPVTGESVPKAKAPDDNVFAGTINADAVLDIRVTAAAADNTIARVIRLVEEAQESKAPTERFIDRFSRWYTPAVLVGGALVAIVPPLAFGQGWDEWIYKGLAVLLIGCPCALVISTPAAIAAGLAAGARRGLLMKGGGVLEQLRRITAVAFDKTGTLTEGRPDVTDIVGLGRPADAVLSLAAALETGSSHPLARAILARAAADKVPVPPAADSRAVPGKGVAGRIGGEEVQLLSPEAAGEAVALPSEVSDRIAALNDAGRTVSVLLVGSEIAGLVAAADTPRADARDGVAALTRQGITAIMLTGDTERVAKAVAGELGIEARASLLPAEKQEVVRALQREGKVVAKVGDGINDAPALAAADIGIAMGGGTDVALETADAASLHGRVGDVAAMIGLSRATMTNIAQNIAVALGLKAVFLVTTVIGVTGLWPAILADTGATVLVTLNALRLLGWRPAA